MKEQKKFIYYNESYFARIRKLVNENYLEIALVECQNYLSQYPNDSCASSYYADILMRLGMFEQAEEVLNNIVFVSTTPDKSKQSVMLMRLKLLNFQQKYEECLQLLIENLDVFNERDWHGTELLLFFKKKLNLLLDVDYSGFSYKADQIISYSEKDAISCIRNCHFIANNSRNIHQSFNNDFPIEDIYSKIRSVLPLEEKIYDGVVEVSYIFKYDRCGRVYNKSVDYIKVIALPESNDIITMFPYDNKGATACMDLTPVFEEEQSKIKRMSQIDKFNQRYGKKVDNN